MVEVVNIVASGHFGQEIALRPIYTDLNSFDKKYEPEQFPGLQIRFDDDNTVLTIYTTGSYTIMGAETRAEINEIYDAFIGRISDLGVDLSDTSEPPKVRNLICKANIEQNLNLSMLTIGLGMESVEYEPEQSPFIYYRPQEFDCLITIPANGEVIVTGVKTLDQAEKVFNHLVNRIEELCNIN
jgi:transcription initiation factor TFIID TATA-box-binding protein